MTKRKLLSAMLIAMATPCVMHIAQAADAFPFKAFDTHTHLISDDTKKYPRVAATPASGPASGMGTDTMGAAMPGAGMNAAPSAANFTPVASANASPQADRLLSWWTEHGVEAGAAVQKRGTYGYDNSYILDSADQNKTRLAPVVVLDAQDVKTPAYLREIIKSHGVAGVRLTGNPADDGSFPWLNSEQALKTWQVANDAGLVVDLMNVPPGKSPAIITEYIKLAQRFPKVRMVLDHVAWPDVKGAPDYGIDAIHQALAKQKNIYYKFTTINIDLLDEGKIAPAEFLRRVVDVYGADHVMWGSDIGNSAGTYDQMISRAVAASAKLTDAEKRKVFHDTGKSVFVRGGKQ
ncbi:MAG: amidohydrolase family protein [Steroidobacteraceae bacterium]